MDTNQSIQSAVNILEEECKLMTLEELNQPINKPTTMRQLRVASLCFAIQLLVAGKERRGC